MSQPLSTEVEMQEIKKRQPRKTPSLQSQKKIIYRDKSTWDIGGFLIGFILGIFILISFWFLTWVGAFNRGTYQSIVCTFPSE